MNCGRPDCNGIHTNSHGHLYSELCQSAKERSQRAKREQRKTPGTYGYNAIHGIGAAGETTRSANRRARHTPGTYAYNRARGIGAAGEIGRQAQWRQYQTPGTYIYMASHGEGRPGLRKYITDRTRTLTREREGLIAKHPEVYAEYLQEKN